MDFAQTLVDLHDESTPLKGLANADFSTPEGRAILREAFIYTRTQNLSLNLDDYIRNKDIPSDLVATISKDYAHPEPDTRMTYNQELIQTDFQNAQGYDPRTLFSRYQQYIQKMVDTPSDIRKSYWTKETATKAMQDFRTICTSPDNNGVSRRKLIEDFLSNYQPFKDHPITDVTYRAFLFVDLNEFTDLRGKAAIVRREFSAQLRKYFE
jgi:hypothetical protein